MVNDSATLHRLIMDVVMIYFYSKRFRFAPSFNYQNFIEMTSNMIHILALGVGLKCPRKIHLNTQCPSTITLVVSLIETAFYTFQRTRCLVKLAFRQFLAALHHRFSKEEKLQSPWRRSKVRRWRGA
jgi:hypothetical protein